MVVFISIAGPETLGFPQGREARNFTVMSRLILLRCPGRLLSAEISAVPE